MTTAHLIKLANEAIATLDREACQGDGAGCGMPHCNHRPSVRRRNIVEARNDLARATEDTTDHDQARMALRMELGPASWT